MNVRQLPSLHGREASRVERLAGESRGDTVNALAMASPSKLPSIGARPRSAIDGSRLRSYAEPGDTANGAALKSAKRRSLLPAFNKKPSAEEQHQIREDVDESDEVESVASSGASEPQPRKAMEEMDRRAMPPPPSKLGRPASVYTGGFFKGSATRLQPPQASQKGHGRADALAALEGAGPEGSTSRPAPTIPKRTTSTRLPQSGVPQGLKRTSSIKPRDPAHSKTKIVQQKEAHHTANGSTSTNTAPGTTNKRGSIVGSRLAPSDGPQVTGRASSSASNVTTPTSPKKPHQAQAQANRRSQMLPPPRPAFNTFQQHYSPAKSGLPKPPIPNGKSIKAPALVTTEETPMSFEASKQQIELLQLSLLHQSGLKTLREYESSAQHKLSKKQSKLRKEFEAIRELEMEQQHIANLTSLDTWCPDSALLAENLQILSKVHTELSALTEPESRYANLVSMFEAWTQQTEVESMPIFLDSLPPDWHKSHTSLALRLRALQRDVELLPPPPPAEASSSPSSVAVLLLSSRQLLDNMLRELEMMTKLEKELLEREKTRIEEEIDAIDYESVVSSDWTPAWRSVQ
ncbi:hypothetical protein EJ03DRAFT_325829 [Teratosphaeria nubilosa]|uniref:Uncharacterized protein n=1 Tax=Teratosphaeria nubilosa TaxID=161662 RepID=A0A6G1LDL2_9PEZI|nr:hypothetical protein EJ03DRAFT_325829 [Teratosphaeria nubilosa]